MKDLQVDVVVPSYNRERALAANVPLLLMIPGVAHVVVVLDGATDGSRKLLESFDDPRLVVVEHPVNRGAAAARDSGARASTADWVLFVDDHDRVPPDTVEVLLAGAEAFGADVIAGPLVHALAGEDPEPIADACRSNPLVDPPTWRTSHTEFPSSEVETPYLPMNALIRREVLDRVPFSQVPKGSKYRTETSYFLRVVAAGFRCVLTPRTYSWKVETFSGGQRSGSALRNEADAVRNTWRFLQLHRDELRARGEIGSVVGAQVGFLGERLRLRLTRVRHAASISRARSNRHRTEPGARQRSGAAAGPALMCLATADLDGPLWTNKQHLMTRLAAAGLRVVYVDSPGHRAATASKSDRARMVRRLKAWRYLARPFQPGLWRDSPLVVPNYSYASIRRLNIGLLRRRLHRNAVALDLGRPVLWTYSPLAADLYDPERHTALVYHCVDDVAVTPGIDGEQWRLNEDRLIAMADVCIGSSRPLCDRLHRLGARRVVYWPNPADTTAFAAAREEALHVPATERNPRAGFIGAISEHKVDMALVRGLAERLPEVDVVLAGPVGQGIGHTTIDLTNLPPNLELVGPIARTDLPAFLQTVDVGLIPYVRSQYTEGVFPMKVFEYLAAGLPVVSSELPSLVGEVEHLTFASTPAEFADSVAEALAKTSPAEAAERSRYASAFSWEARVNEALELLRSL